MISGVFYLFVCLFVCLIFHLLLMEREVGRAIVRHYKCSCRQTDWKQNFLKLLQLREIPVTEVLFLGLEKHFLPCFPFPNRSFSKHSFSSTPDSVFSLWEDDWETAFRVSCHGCFSACYTEQWVGGWQYRSSEGPRLVVFCCWVHLKESQLANALHISNFSFHSPDTRLSVRELHNSWRRHSSLCDIS